MKKILYIFNIFKKLNSNNEDEQRQEFILNVILYSFIVFLFLLTILYIFTGLKIDRHYYIHSSLYIFVIWSAFIFLLYLSRVGRIRHASYGLIILLKIFSTLAAIRWGVDLPSVIISYILTIIMANILFGSHVGILSTIILSLLLFTIGYWQIEIMPPHSNWRQEKMQIEDMISFSIELFFIMSLSGLSNHLLSISLKRARYSETKLVRELERIKKVYHFAEFGKLSSGAFHDLINPLTTISLNIDSIQNSTHPDLIETKSNINIALKASKRMQNFIEAIEKQISIKENVRLFSINEEIDQAIELISYKSRLAKCKIIFSPRQNIFYTGNALAFYQIMTNLISNAVDSYQNVEKNFKIINVTSVESEKEISITVKDGGIGIKPEIMKEIFEPFFTTKLDHRGFGLGLTTTKEKVEREFGGTLSLTSVPNQGSTFTVNLPKQQNHD